MSAEAVFSVSSKLFRIFMVAVMVVTFVAALMFAFEFVGMQV